MGAQPSRLFSALLKFLMIPAVSGEQKKVSG